MLPRPHARPFRCCAAVRVLKRALPKPFCMPDLVAFYEDVMVAKCLKDEAGLLPMDTRDDMGRERFHPFSPDGHLGLQLKKNEKPVSQPASPLGAEAWSHAARCRAGTSCTRTTSRQAGTAARPTPYPSTVSMPLRTASPLLCLPAGRGLTQLRAQTARRS